ncbi:MAG: deoxyribose-phosphate aldolase [Flavobacteriales bacterium]
MSKQVDIQQLFNSVRCVQKDETALHTVEKSGCSDPALLLSCVDLTSLSALDTHDGIRAMCEKAISLQASGLPTVAAVCVYPAFVKVAAEALEGSSIKVASVAGGFPSSQIPLRLKLEEIGYALDAGADEIDVVMPVGKFLSGEYNTVFNEFCEIRKKCGQKILKIILETGLLPTADDVQKASLLAIASGADFIKTSTGKEGGGASAAAVYVMAKTVLDAVETGVSDKRTGIKPSGGISDFESAAQFASLVSSVLGDDFVSSETFRIGASRLANVLLKELDPDTTSQF